MGGGAGWVSSGCLITQVPSSGHRYRKRIRKIRGVFCFGREKVANGWNEPRKRESERERGGNGNEEKVCCVEASIL